MAERGTRTASPEHARIEEAKRLLQAWLGVLDLLAAGVGLFQRREEIEQHLAELERAQATKEETARVADETREREQTEAERALQAKHTAFLANLTQTEESRRAAADLLVQRIIDLKAERAALEAEVIRARSTHADLLAGFAQAQRTAEAEVEAVRAQLRAVRDGIAV